MTNRSAKILIHLGKYCLTFFFALLFSTEKTSGAKDSTGRHIIGLDVTGLLLQPRPGIYYQYERSFIQFRGGLQYKFSSSELKSDTSTLRTSNRSLTPSIGLSWVITDNNFSFYAGSDIFYTFNRETSSSKPITVKRKSFGFKPVLGFKYPLYKGFLLGIEGFSDASWSIIDDLKSKTKTEYLNFEIFDSYSLYLFYSFSFKKKS